MWSFDDFDSLDFGVELETVCERTFTVTWEAPGEREGIRLSEARLLEANRNAVAAAVWDVSDSERWKPFMRTDITDVVLHYRPWGTEEGFWCSRISLSFGARGGVELLLAEGSKDQVLHPSANNVAVLFSRDALPTWG
jgi:hypothetical protein